MKLRANVVCLISQSEVNFFGRVVKQLGHCHETQQLLFGRLSHLDLLKLFGYRWDDNDLLLVYEFKKKGSFENHPFKSKRLSFYEDTGFKLMNCSALASRHR